MIYHDTLQNISYRASEILSKTGKKNTINWNADHRVDNHNYATRKCGRRYVAITDSWADSEGKEEGMIEGPRIRYFVLILCIIRNWFAAIVWNPLENLFFGRFILVLKLFQ